MLAQFLCEELDNITDEDNDYHREPPTSVDLDAVEGTIVRIEFSFGFVEKSTKELILLIEIGDWMKFSSVLKSFFSRMIA